MWIYFSQAYKKESSSNIGDSKICLIKDMTVDD